MARAVHTNDYDIRSLVVRALLDSGMPRDSIRHEITLDTSSSGGRADMVLLFDDRLVGLEVKSGKDTLARLKDQKRQYGTRFDHIVLVADERHEPALGASHEYGFSPHSDNVVFARRDRASGLLALDAGRWTGVVPTLTAAPQGYPRYRPRCLSAFGMMALLWRNEACAVSQRPGTRERAIDFAGDAISLRDLRPLVCAQLRKRSLSRWEEAFWNRFDIPLDIAA